MVMETHTLGERDVMFVRMLSFAANVTRLPQCPTSEHTDPFSIEASAIFHTGLQEASFLFILCTYMPCGGLQNHLSGAILTVLFS